MAETTLLVCPAPCWTGDNDAQLVTGDNAAVPVRHKGRFAWSFDDTDEAAIISAEQEMPSAYSSGTLKARIHFAMESDASNDVAIDAFVEAKTPDSDTLDMETATGWDSANSGTKSLSGTTAGDPLILDITLTNKDSVAAGDLVRFGMRRDCDSANDDASGDLYIYSVTIFEDG